MFENNQMIVNPDKFQAIIIDKSKKSEEPYLLNINNVEITSKPSVQLLGLEIDVKLDFENHIEKICKKGNAQLNAFIRIQKYFNRREKEIIINTLLYSNFSYCALAWHFCSQKSVKKNEKVQERSLRTILSDFENDYEILLQKTDNQKMEVKRMRNIAVEIFKTMNNLNPEFMKNIFFLSPYKTHRPNNIYTKL